MIRKKQTSLLNYYPQKKQKMEAQIELLSEKSRLIVQSIFESQKGDSKSTQYSYFKSISLLSSNSILNKYQQIMNDNSKLPEYYSHLSNVQKMIDEYLQMQFIKEQKVSVELIEIAQYFEDKQQFRLDDRIIKQIVFVDPFLYSIYSDRKVTYIEFEYSFFYQFKDNILDQKIYLEKRQQSFRSKLIKLFDTKNQKEIKIPSNFEFPQTQDEQDQLIKRQNILITYNDQQTNKKTSKIKEKERKKEDQQLLNSVDEQEIIEILKTYYKDRQVQSSYLNNVINYLDKKILKKDSDFLEEILLALTRKHPHLMELKKSRERIILVFSHL